MGDNKTTAIDYVRLLSTEILTGLKKVLKIDMDMFGYTFDSRYKPVCNYGSLNENNNKGNVA